MKKGNFALALRVFALMGVIAANSVITARAEPEPCYGCLYGTCGQLAYGSGHSFCQSHDDHCDMFDPCTIPL